MGDECGFDHGPWVQFRCTQLRKGMFARLSTCCIAEGVGSVACGDGKKKKQGQLQLCEEKLRRKRERGMGKVRVRVCEGGGGKGMARGRSERERERETKRGRVGGREGGLQVPIKQEERQNDQRRERSVN